MFDEVIASVKEFFGSLNASNQSVESIRFKALACSILLTRTRCDGNGVVIYTTIDEALEELAEIEKKVLLSRAPK